ncbi:Tat pathway signal protein [Caproiciproducens sp. NJN-50]|uniref:tripartite tricarboxylate transporter permease n=1 Tax=Acutalibacteraceae TaxID=3082771 RepID=UPI000FFE128D|nr:MULTISPECIES: tripartite tricarboxylate transporter permease [Acutalibacteraceae]QAT50622.1 Tat pathway signal protein [Caproiciproducens sp. NJN-50]
MSTYLTSLLICFQPVHFLLIVGTCIVGIIFGAIPGLSAAIGISLLLPVTFSMDTETSFCMLLAMYIGGVSGAFISATLMGIPGASSSIATTFDAYPMTQKGEASKALSIGIIASFIGTLGSILIATFLSPLIAQLALMLGPWEYFSLCFCAITLVSALAEGSMFKCLLSTAIGLLLGYFGMDSVSGVLRFTFGNHNLDNGISLIAITLGVFACLQVVENFAKGSQELPEVKKANLKGLGLKRQDFTEHIGTIVRSFLLGLWVGFLPGIGSGVSNLIAYAQAKSSSKHSELFGTGYPGGIWASETSNNASVGGAIIPMIALGIPGDSITAMLLTGMMIHGLQPGPLLMSSNPEISYLVFACVLVSAIVVLIVELATKRWFPMILKIPYHFLYSAILVICFIGAFTAANSIFDIYMMLACCALGIVMKIAKIPVSPLLLSFVLSGNLESYFRNSISYANGSYAMFFTRPVSFLFILVGVLSIVWPTAKKAFGKKDKWNKEKKAEC